ncbi:uncharacterized protein LOC144429691 [Styela clava]
MIVVNGIFLHIYSLLRLFSERNHFFPDIRRYSKIVSVRGNTVATAETFYVIAEREVVCSCRSFFEAVAFQFASLYVFNIEYPKKALLTFDFIQRFFGDINPRGTKSKKSKGKDVHAKVIGLARRVNLSQALYVPLLEIDV